MSKDLEYMIEHTVLCSMILSSRALKEVTELVEFEENLFHAEEHKMIARGIKNLLDKEEKIDVLTLSNELKKLNINFINDEDTISYLLNLISIVDSTQNIETHTRILSEFAIKRFNAKNIIALSNLNAEPLIKLEQIENYIYKIKNKFFRQANYDTTLKNHLDNLYSTNTEAIKTNTIFDEFGGGLYRSEYGVIGGRPGTGKTAIALYLTRNLAKQGYKVLFISMEMPSRLVLIRLLSAQLKIPELQLKTNKLDDMQRYNVLTYKNDNVFIDDKCTTLKNIFNSIEKHKAKYDIDVVFFDYIQKVTDFEEHKNKREDQQIGYLTKGLEAKAKELNISIVALSQLNRDNKTNRPPILTDFKGSGNIEQDAYFVLALHEQAELKNTLDLIMLKNRNGEKETVHSIGTNFQYMDFEEVEKTNYLYDNYYDNDKF